MVAVTYFYTEF